MDQSEQKGIARLLKDYWFVIVFIGSLIVSWTLFTQALGSVTDRVTYLESEERTNAIAQSQMLVQLSQIQTDLQWIKERFK